MQEMTLAEEANLRFMFVALSASVRRAIGWLRSTSGTGGVFGGG